MRIWEVLGLRTIIAPKVEILARANISRPPVDKRDWLVSNIRFALISHIGYITLSIHGY